MAKIETTWSPSDHKSPPPPPPGPALGFGTFVQTFGTVLSPLRNPKAPCPRQTPPPLVDGLVTRQSPWHELSMTSALQQESRLVHGHAQLYLLSASLGRRAVPPLPHDLDPSPPTSSGTLLQGACRPWASYFISKTSVSSSAKRDNSAYLRDLFRG